MPGSVKRGKRRKETSLYILECFRKHRLWPISLYGTITFSRPVAMAWEMTKNSLS